MRIDTSNVTSSQGRLNCTAVAYNFKQYRYKKAYLNTWIVTGSSNGNFFIITGLTSGTNYQWQSRRECPNGGWSAWSYTENFTTSSNLTANQQSDISSKTSVSTTEKDLKTESEVLEPIQLKLLPNPAATGQQLSLEISSVETEVMITVSSISGERILNKAVTLESGKETVYVPGIENPGVYLITVQTKLQRVTERLIIVE